MWIRFGSAAENGGESIKNARVAAAAAMDAQFQVYTGGCNLTVRVGQRPNKDGARVAPIIMTSTTATGMLASVSGHGHLPSQGSTPKGSGSSGGG